MTTIDIICPEEQEGTKIQMGNWLKAVGDSVEANEAIAELNTDKVSLELVAPAAGIISEIFSKEGDDLTTGQVLATLQISDTESAPDRIIQTTQAIEEAVKPEEQLDKSESHQATDSSQSSLLSPAVKKLLKTHELDPSKIKGSGKGQRITVSDVESAIGSDSSNNTKIPHSATRLKTAERMVHSLLHTAPHVTSVFEANFDSLLAKYDVDKKSLATDQTKLTLSSYFVTAAAFCLKKFPLVNAKYHDDFLELESNINIGLATAVPEKGLFLPVIHNADTLNLKETAKVINELTTRARQGSLTMADLKNPSFSISNHGVSGSLFATPIIIPQPQVAILGIGKLHKKVKLDESSNKVINQNTCYISLTIDHRALDGHQANEFLQHFVELIENPEALGLDRKHA